MYKMLFVDVLLLFIVRNC